MLENPRKWPRNSLLDLLRREEKKDRIVGWGVSDWGVTTHTVRQKRKVARPRRARARFDLRTASFCVRLSGRGDPTRKKKSSINFKIRIGTSRIVSLESETRASSVAALSPPSPHFHHHPRSYPPSPLPTHHPSTPTPHPHEDDQNDPIRLCTTPRCVIRQRAVRGCNG